MPLIQEQALELELVIGMSRRDLTLADPVK